MQALANDIHPNGTYQCWYKIFGDDSSKVDDVYTPNGNKDTLFAKFGYVITFMNEDEIFQTLYTTTGTKGNQLADLGKNPTLGTYTFRDWYTGKNGTGTKITTSYQFSGNTTVYAKWVSVMSWDFNGTGGTDGNGSGNGSIEILKGEKWELPFAGQSTYTWKGWYSDENFWNRYGEQGQNMTPVGSVNLRAKWVSVIRYMNPFVGVYSARYAVKRYEQYGGNVEVLKGEQCILPDMPSIGEDGGETVSMYNDAFYDQQLRTNQPAADHAGSKIGIKGQSYIPTGNITLYGQRG